MMTDSLLFDRALGVGRLETLIERDGNTLLIPEGIQTIPCTHGIHRFPGKFIPNLPRYLLRSLLSAHSGQVVGDPFCGSGTTLVEAALEGRPFIGMDIDPLAVAMSTAKTDPLLEGELDLIRKHWVHYDYSHADSSLVPDVPNLSHWFTHQAVIQLSAIKSGCLSLPPRLRLFCLVVFSSIVRRVSNADDQTQKTYVSHTLPKTPRLPSDVFPIFLRRAILGMKEYSLRIPNRPVGQVLRGDARTPPEVDFGDVITSPPYIDSVDYIYNQMLEYFWLLPELNIHTYDNYRALRRQPMGLCRSWEDVSNRVQDMLSRSSRSEYEGVCQAIRQDSRNEEASVRQFFHDCACHCAMMYRRQKAGAFYICIIGNSMIRRTIVPTVSLIQDLFQAVGYKCEDRMSYEIRRHYMKFPRRGNSGKIKQDHILVFRR